MDWKTIETWEMTITTYIFIKMLDVQLIFTSMVFTFPDFIL